MAHVSASENVAIILCACFYIRAIKNFSQRTAGLQMLTRLEADGFKNLIDFSVDFGPFTCLAGPNGVGKSNIFDAIRFMSLLADHPIMEAAQRVRSDSMNGDEPTEDGSWEPTDIFWTDGRERMDELMLAAEMIVPEKVKDDFGRPAEATSTFLRYEVKIGYQGPSDGSGFGRLKLLSENLEYITKRDSRKRLCFDHSKKHFRDHVISNSRRGADYISTDTADDDQKEILVHQDGGSRGQPKRAPAESAPRTVVGTTNTSSTPTVLAARREMQNWRRLALEPSAMRRVDRLYTDPHITSDGGHLAATLHRLAEESKGDRDRVFARVASRLNELLSVQDVRVDVDEVRRLLTLEVREQSDAFLPTRSLSDGTLRFLTLSIMEQDPEFTGLLCMEEPENGIHPARIPAMMDLLYDITVDPTEEPGSQNPIRQVIVATHSPFLVRLIYSHHRNDLLHAEVAQVRNPMENSSGNAVETIRCRPMRNTLRAEKTRGVGKGTIIDYLTAPPGSTKRIDFPESFSTDPLTNA